MAALPPAGPAPSARAPAGALGLLLLALVACVHAPRLDAVSGLGGVRGAVRLTRGETTAVPRPSVVYLSRPGTSDASWLHRTVTVRRRSGGFQPGFLALTRGQGLRFANEEGVHHRLFALDPAGGIELPLPPRGASRTTRLERPGVLRFYCRLHADEQLTVLVVPSRHFDVVDARGAWAIPRVPPGTWRIHLWSEAVEGPVRRVDVGVLRTQHETIWLDDRRLGR